MPQAIINPFLVVPSGPTFFPDDIAGLVRWYDADSFTGLYADGAIITTDWPDLSVSGEDATPRLGEEPTFKNTILSGGKSSVSFPPVIRRFDTTQLVLGNFSVVAFYRPDGDTIVASDPGGNYQIREQTPTPTSDRPVIRPNTGPSLEFIGTENADIWHMRTWTRNGTTGAPVFYYQKTSEPEDTGDTNTASMLISTIGSVLVNFHLAEMLIYNVVITQADVDNLHDFYFKLKYPLEF